MQQIVFSFYRILEVSLQSCEIQYISIINQSPVEKYLGITVMRRTYAAMKEIRKTLHKMCNCEE